MLKCLETVGWATPKAAWSSQTQRARSIRSRRMRRRLPSARAFNDFSKFFTCSLLNNSILLYRNLAYQIKPQFDFFVEEDKLWAKISAHGKHDDSGLLGRLQRRAVITP